MKKSTGLKRIIHFILYCILCTFFIGVQVNIWPTFNLPIPQLWLLPLAFIILYHDFWVALFFVYSTAALLTGFTVMPFGLALAIIMLLFVIVQFFKQRFFWPDFSFYFLITSSLGLLFPLIHYILSISSKNTPYMAQPDLGTWLYQPLMLGLTSIFVFYLCRYIDKSLYANEIHMSRGV